jgi:hypothetical protein
MKQECSVQLRKIATDVKWALIDYRRCWLLRGASISKEIEQGLEVVARRQMVHQRRAKTERGSYEIHLISIEIYGFG